MKLKVGSLLIFIISISLLWVWFVKQPKTHKHDRVESPTIEAPVEIVSALNRVEKNLGSVAEQRRDISVISKALGDCTVTSKALGKKEKSCWLAPLRMRVDVREAVEAWEKLQELDKELAKTPKWGVSNAEKAKGKYLEGAEKNYRLVCSQIGSPFAVVEGLTKNGKKITYGEVYDVIYRIRSW
jgi:hypothetical protein